MNHEAEDAHHGGTAVVELHTLATIGGDVGVLRLAVALEALLVAVAGEAELHGTDSGDGDGKTGGGQRSEGGNTVLDLVGAKGHAHTSSGHNVAKDGKHRDAAVLGLYVTEAVEAVLVGVVEEAERIPATGAASLLEGPSDRITVGHLHRRGAGHAGHRGKGSGNCNHGNKSDDTEHLQSTISTGRFTR